MIKEVTEHRPLASTCAHVHTYTHIPSPLTQTQKDTYMLMYVNKYSIYILHILYLILKSAIPLMNLETSKRKKHVFWVLLMFLLRLLYECHFYNEKNSINTLYM